MFPSYEEARQFEKEYNMIPVCKEIYADIVTPITLLRRLKEIDSKYYLLESVEGGKQWGQYSFLGVNPLLQISCKNGMVTMKSGAMETTEKRMPCRHCGSCWGSIVLRLLRECQALPVVWWDISPMR